MTFHSTPIPTLRRVFLQAFTVLDLAEPLVSFDDTAPAGDVRTFMQAHRYEIVGVRVSGHPAGFVKLADLGDGVCGDFLQPFDDELVILESTPLPELILRLKNHRRLFVSVLGRVGGVVSRSDLQKPPVRMWLFGMVTLIEMRLNRLIQQHCPEDDWPSFLSAGRLQKAESLLEERRRRGQEVRLLDCLQLADKAQIVARNEALRNMTRFPSRTQLEQAAKMLEKLRNNLAHSQDIVAGDWEAIVALAEQLDELLEGPPMSEPAPPISEPAE